METGKMNRNIVSRERTLWWKSSGVQKYLVTEIKWTREEVMDGSREKRYLNL